MDGEGVNRPDDTHEYVLLSVGRRSLYKKDGSRLTFYDIIPFLWECFLERPTASYVGFYLGYDFANWFRDLPENRARTLFDETEIAKRRRTRSGQNHLPFPVEHRGWLFDILGTKRFRLWRDGSNLRMYICDTGSFFQTSFLATINPEQWPDGPIVNDDEYKIVAAGKAERGQDIVPYGTPIDPKMIEYNILENDILSRLMVRYNEGLVNVGIRLKKSQWFGPGQAAQEWMKQVSAPTRKEFSSVTSIEIRSALQASYYGGWFEIFAHGHIPGESWTYDINSAYPHIQSQLPCCLHGKWTTGTNDKILNNDSYYLVYGLVCGSHNSIGSLPHRIKSGHILRPSETKGWYWLHEINAAKQCGLIDNILIEKWIKYAPCKCPPPFTDLRTLYRDRQRVGPKTIGGKSRKLVYNSAYGKTAQSVGTAKYANAFYASLITSYCRTLILRAIQSHQLGANDVLMVATDGITFRHRHNTDNTFNIDSQMLGAWTENNHRNLTLFMPGIYWDDRTRTKLANREHPSLKSRGIPAKALTNNIKKIDELFTDCYNGNGWPELDLPISFTIISPKQALAWNRWQDCGTVIFNNIRHVNANPSIKRCPAVIMENGILRSTPWPKGPSGLETTPYSKTFGDEELTDYLTPDGLITMLHAEALE